MYYLSAWQVKELAKAYLRGKTCVDDLDDKEYNDILQDPYHTSMPEDVFEDLAESLFQELYNVEQKGW